MTNNINTVHLTGTVRTEPRLRELPTGVGLWVFELDTHGATLPIIYDGPLVPWAKGTQVDITGMVVSRYFRVGGATQRKIEVLANSIKRGDT